jgi:hypothetical protein
MWCLGPNHLDAMGYQEPSDDGAPNSLSICDAFKTAILMLTGTILMLTGTCFSALLLKKHPSNKLI